MLLGVGEQTGELAVGWLAGWAGLARMCSRAITHSLQFCFGQRKCRSMRAKCKNLFRSKSKNGSASWHVQSHWGCGWLQVLIAAIRRFPDADLMSSYSGIAWHPSYVVVCYEHSAIVQKSLISLDHDGIIYMLEKPLPSLRVPK